jgi:hypothetical protein
MRRSVLILSAFAFVLALVPSAQAGDDAAAIIAKAIKAHFPKGLDGKQHAVRTSGKGTLHIMGMDLPFTQQVTVDVPKRFKEVMEISADGKTVTVTTVFNGKDAWIRAGDKDVPVNKDILNELKDAAYFMGLTQGLFTKDKALKFSLLGEVQVNGKAAVGVKISKGGKKDINLYFDKASGLMAKVELRKLDIASGQEVTEERFITEYQDVKGRKVAKKAEVKRDGNPLVEIEITDVQFLESVDASEFARPE